MSPQPHHPATTAAGGVALTADQPAIPASAHRAEFTVVETMTDDGLEVVLTHATAGRFVRTAQSNGWVRRDPSRPYSSDPEIRACEESHDRDALIDSLVFLAGRGSTPAQDTATELLRMPLTHVRPPVERLVNADASAEMFAASEPPALQVLADLERIAFRAVELAAYVRTRIEGHTHHAGALETNRASRKLANLLGKLRRSRPYVSF